MTKAAVTKLVFIVILAFIVCLPEFFTIHRVLSVSLRCELSDLWRKNPCLEQWEHLGGAAANQRNMTEADINCFVCEVHDVKMAGFDGNNSLSAHNIHLEVWLHLQLTDPLSVNLTLFGHYNHTSLRLRLPDGEEEGNRTQNNNALTKDFLHCDPSLDTANHSHCLLWLSNQTFTTAKGRLPWKHTTKGKSWLACSDEWRCVVRVVWLGLLCVVLLFIIITVIGEIYRDTRDTDKAKTQSLNCNIQCQQINKERYFEVSTQEARDFSTYIPRYWPALSTIEEVGTPDETEILLNRNMDYGKGNQIYTQNTVPPYPQTEDQTAEDSL